MSPTVSGISGLPETVGSAASEFPWAPSTRSHISCCSSAVGRQRRNKPKKGQQQAYQSWYMTRMLAKWMARRMQAPSDNKSDISIEQLWARDRLACLLLLSYIACLPQLSFLTPAPNPIFSRILPCTRMYMCWCVIHKHMYMCWCVIHKYTYTHAHVHAHAWMNKSKYMHMCVCKFLFGFSETTVFHVVGKWRKSKNKVKKGWQWCVCHGFYYD
jgi:hypothetical protein